MRATSFSVKTLSTSIITTVLNKSSFKILSEVSKIVYNDKIFFTKKSEPSIIFSESAQISEGGELTEIESIAQNAFKLYKSRKI